MPMDNPKFQINTDAKGEYRFILRSKNGEIILRSSEGYTTKQGCLGGIASVKINAPYDSRYVSRSYQAPGKSEQYYFVLRAGNNEILGISEMYTTTASRDNGMAAVKRDAPNAPVEDLTEVKNNPFYR